MKLTKKQKAAVKRNVVRALRDAARFWYGDPKMGLAGLLEARHLLKIALRAVERER